jgi:hypothetical protein
MKRNLVSNSRGIGSSHTRFQDVHNYKDVDILFLGSSHAYRGFDGRIFKKYGFESFNLGTPAQTLIQTELLLKKYFKDLNPELVVLELNPGGMSSDGVESTLDIIPHVELDLDFAKVVFKQKHITAYNSFLYGVYCQVFKSKKPSSVKFRNGKDLYVEGGFVERDLSFNKKGNLPHKLNGLKIQDNQLSAFERIISSFKSNNVSVILVQAPVTSKYYSCYEKNENFDSIIQSYQYPYYNFNTILNLDDSLDFYDSHHLNQNGVEIFNEAFIHSVLLKSN